MATESCRIGIDLGGTKTCGVLVDGGGRIIGDPLETPTNRQRPPHDILNTVVAMIEGLLGDSGRRQLDVEGVGLGIPTTLDESGRMAACPNLPTMTGFSLGQELEQRLRRRVSLENDANCLAYGEWRTGVGKGAKILCGITLGTCFGLGTVIDGRIHRGSHGEAGEIGTSPYRQGQCVEDVASGLGIEAYYKQVTGQSFDARTIASLAQEGDDVAIKAWRTFGKAVGFELSYVVNVLDPEIVVMGGSIAAASNLFEGPMRGILKRNAYSYQRLRVTHASLGKFGGAVGAALLS